MSKDEDLRSLIQQQLRQREEVRKKGDRLPPLRKPGTGPAKPGDEAASPRTPEQPPRAPERGPRPEPRPQGDGYRFLNPYNFCRYLQAPEEEAIRQSAETRLLWRCEPAPHDRYLGLSGRIACSLTAVTPLFVSDSHGIEVEETKGGKEHKSYGFFQYDGRDAIPATGLRGAIRSVFEAATNSCFAVFHNDRLSYRMEPGVAATLVPGRVEQDPRGGWRLRLLPGFAAVNPGGRPRALYAGTVRRYDPIEPPRRKGPPPSQPPKPIALGGLVHGDLCYALVTKRGIFTYVDKVARTAGELGAAARDQQVVQGWLCINNQNIENKSKERVFFRDPFNRTDPEFLHIDGHVVAGYEDLIKDYQERHKDAVKARKDNHQRLDGILERERDVAPALSRYVYDRNDLKLEDGRLVYARLSSGGRQSHVEEIAPAAVPRVSYHHSVGDLLQDYPHLYPCTEYEALCPACRVFGWVYDAHEGSQKPPADKTTAYAGRVRFSHALLAADGDAGKLDDITLAILSSPKPTTTRFYLRPKSGEPRDGLNDAQAGYDGDNLLRGRKFYRHHGQAHPAEYERVTTPEFDGKDDQNRTVRGARKPGNRFEFTVDFENLAPVELGALLWSLELDGEGYHRLGFAKPLGFGSARLEVTDLDLMSPMSRYTGLEPDGGWQDARTRKEEWVTLFQETMAALHGAPFEELENVRDLKALLGEPPELPVHYPRVDREPSAEGKNFEWFVGNKRTHGPRIALSLADEDAEGLPLVDRKGTVRR